MILYYLIFTKFSKLNNKKLNNKKLNDKKLNDKKLIFAIFCFYIIYFEITLQLCTTLKIYVFIKFLYFFTCCRKFNLYISKI